MNISYYVIDLGTLCPTAISKANRLITGRGPFLWAGPGSYLSANPQVPVPPSGSSGVGAAVNSRGDVAGSTFSSMRGRAFLTPLGDSPVDIHALLSPTTDSYAFDVNDYGDVVGYMAGVGVSDQSPGLNGWLYSGNAVTNLTTAVDERITEAASINNGRKIAGRLASGEVYTFDVGLGPVVGFSTLGVSAARNGLRINDRGQLAGNQQGGAPFVFQNGGRALLSGVGGPNLAIAGLNNIGQVVASDGADVFVSGPMTPVGPAVTPVMYSMKTLLDTPGWVVTHAFDIDDGGAIVGTGSLSGGEKHGVLLVPEPFDARRIEKLLFVRILLGIINDGAGIMVPGGRVPPVPPIPIGPELSLTSGQRDALLGLAIDAQADLIADRAVRNEMKQLSARLLREASERLSEPQATDGSRSGPEGPGKVGGRS